jgi:elongation factor P
MTLASDVKAGMAIRLDGKLYKILEAIRHTGSGQMHGFLELKLKDIQFGHFANRHFKVSDRLEEIAFSKRQMQYLYSDADACVFMDLETFDQVRVPRGGVSGVENFLEEGMKVPVELLDGQAVSLDFPKVVEIRVEQTGPGVRGGQDTTMKPAILKNGMEILVPHFVETGDMIRVETEKAKYIDRVAAKKL